MALLDRITDDLHEKCMEIFAQYQKEMNIRDGAEPWEWSNDYDKAELQLAEMIKKTLLWQKEMDNIENLFNKEG